MCRFYAKLAVFPIKLFFELDSRHKNIRSHSWIWLKNSLSEKFCLQISKAILMKTPISIIPKIYLIEPYSAFQPTYQQKL